MCDVVKLEPITDIEVAHLAKLLCVESMRQVTEDLHPFQTLFIKMEPASEPLDQETEIERLYVDHEVKKEMAIGPTIVQPYLSDLHQQIISNESTTSEEHVEIQSKDRHHKYKTCDKEYKENPKTEVNNSLVTTDTKLLACSECDKVFNSRNGLKAHLPTHTGENPYKCGECGKHFVRRSNLRSHFMNLHTDVRPYICAVCNKGFKTKTALNIHSYVHAKEKPYKCDECGKQFKYNRQCKQHVIFVHTDIKRYTCNICKKKFPSNHGLKRHVPIHTGKPYQCDVCFKTFADKNHLNAHIGVHNINKSHICEYCSKRFASSKFLQRHVTKHTAEKLYECNFCSKKFTVSNNSVPHTTLHTDSKYKYTAFTCDVCCKEYANTYLQKHIRKYTEDKTYKCEVCSKMFAFSSDLKWHANEHIDNKLHGCTICNKMFITSNFLKNHMETHTSENELIVKQ